MRLDVAVNGRSWTVAIDPGGHTGEFAVDVNGRTRMIDVSWIDANTLSLIDGSASREVRVHRRDGGVMGVTIAGRTLEAVVSAQKHERMPFADPHSSVVKAPMPGRIVRVLVAVGDLVSVRQGVAIVEAMKMENELRAPRSGTVTEITVAAGDAVETGAVVLVIGD